MERLTTKWNDGSYDTFDPIDIVENEYSKANYERVLAKLGEYEDLEEQGLLLKLPCKVGDCVYYISPHNTISLDEGVIYEGDVTRVYAMEEEICITIKIHTDYGVTELSNITEFGKIVFLTKEEAEEALRKKVE